MNSVISDDIQSISDDISDDIPMLSGTAKRKPSGTTLAALK